MPRNIVPVGIGRIRFSHLFDQCRHDNIISQGKSRAPPPRRKKMNRTLTLSQLLERPKRAKAKSFYPQQVCGDELATPANISFMSDKRAEQTTVPDTLETDMFNLKEPGDLLH